LINLYKDPSLEWIGSEHDHLALCLPPACGKNSDGSVRLVDGAPQPIHGLPAYPETALRVSPKSSGDNLAQLHAVVMCHHPLEALHEVPRNARIVGARFVGVDHAHTRSLQRELVERRLVRLEARESADIVDEDNVSDAAIGVRTKV